MGNLVSFTSLIATVDRFYFFFIIGKGRIEVSEIVTHECFNYSFTYSNDNNYAYLQSEKIIKWREINERAVRIVGGIGLYVGQCCG